MTTKQIERAGRLLAEAIEGPARVIVFGSHARGDAREGSDLDILVVEQHVEDRLGEAVRLGRVLRSLRVPTDVVVVSEARAKEWGDVPGTMLHAALTEGRVVAET